MNWSWQQRRGKLEIGYGGEPHFPQVAVLHLGSGYFRMIPDAEYSWGASVVLPPVVWESSGVVRQGASLKLLRTDVQHGDFEIEFSARVSTLKVHGLVRLSPPNGVPTPDGSHSQHEVRSNSGLEMKATVRINCRGEVKLIEDEHADEAFKTVMLSSMHIRSEDWDVVRAYTEEENWPLVKRGYIVKDAACTRFGLIGGHSRKQLGKGLGWSPSLDICFREKVTVRGWITDEVVQKNGSLRAATVNDENVAIWAGGCQSLQSWEYEIRAY